MVLGILVHAKMRHAFQYQLHTEAHNHLTEITTVLEQDDTANVSGKWISLW